MTAIELRPADGATVALIPDAVAKRDTLLVGARKVTSITDDLDLEVAADSARTLKSMAKETEASRKRVKEPVLALAKAVDTVAAEFIAPVSSELTRIERLMSDYHSEQRRQAAEAEAARQRELARIESERLKAERDASHAELVRLAAEEADRKAAERELLGQQVKQSELAIIEGQKAKAAADAEALRIQQEKLARAAQAAASVPAVAPTRTAGMVTRKVWDFEVLDIWKVPRDFVRIEPNREAILDALRRGVTDIPGLRCWQETKTGVR